MSAAAVPFGSVLAAPAAGTGLNPSRGVWHRWSLVVVYAVAMAWMEAAVVFYLRSMIQRLNPYQADPLPLVGGFALAEIAREAATLVMLVCVGWLAGRCWRTRIAYTLLAFGVWDIAYYVWLMPLTGWPRSLGDWDILFLIPLPWWGPVWAPTSIAALMVVFGSIVTAADPHGRVVWPGRASAVGAAAGVGLALYAFTADALKMVLGGGSATDVRSILPATFSWKLFAVALALIALPVTEVAWRSRRWLRSRGAPPDTGRWCPDDGIAHPGEVAR